MLAGLYRISVSHADFGFRIQTFPADGNRSKGPEDVARRFAVDAHVAGDVHVAGDGEGCVGPYATTTILGFVAGDAAAGHGKCTGRIHAAAIRFILIAGAGYIVGNTAAGHGEFGPVVHIHAAAVRGGGIAGNAAAFHVERSLFIHIHAAAATGHGVAGNAAAVHIECGVFHIHAAAERGSGGVAGNAAAVHIEHATVHRNTPAEVLFVATTIPVGDLALAAAAVAEGKVAGFKFDDTGIIVADKGDAVAIQAKGHFVGGFPGSGDLNILRQVVVARPGDLGEVGNGSPGYRRVFLAVYIAANGVVVVADQGERLARAVILQAVFAVVAGEAFRILLADVLGNDLICGLHAHADAGRSVQHSIDVDGVALAVFVFIQIDIATRVARDLRRAGDCEGCVGTGAYVHTAASAAVAGDAAAAHGERAAATGREIMVSIQAADKHAAAFFSVVAADLAAAHKEAALIGDKHAAAKALFVYTPVSGDLAAVHIKCAAPDKHAAGAGCVLAAGFPWVVIVDCAAVHFEYGVIFSGCILCGGRLTHKHAGASPAFVRDSAAIAIAVAKGEGDIGLNMNDRAVIGHTDAVPIEAKHRAVGGLPCAVDCHILGQVVVARPGDFIQTGNGFPLYIGVLIVGVAARLAANRVVGVAAGGRLCRWFLPRGFGRLLLVRVLLVRVLLVRVLLVRILLVRLLLIWVLLLRLLLVRLLLIRLLLVRLLLVRLLLVRLLLVRNLLLRLYLVGTGSRYLRQRRRRQHGKADGNCHQQA